MVQHSMQYEGIELSVREKVGKLIQRPIEQVEARLVGERRLPARFNGASNLCRRKIDPIYRGRTKVR